jgi:hypothetical protein
MNRVPIVPAAAALVAALARWVAFPSGTLPKPTLPNPHGIVVNGTYHELFPSMYLTP